MCFLTSSRSSCRLAYPGWLSLRIFAAALSSSLNSIAATASTISTSRSARGRDDKHYLRVSHWLTLAWGIDSNRRGARRHAAESFGARSGVVRGFAD